MQRVASIILLFVLWLNSIIPVTPTSIGPVFSGNETGVQPLQSEPTPTATNEILPADPTVEVTEPITEATLPPTETETPVPVETFTPEPTETPLVTETVTPTETITPTGTATPTPTPTLSVTLSLRATPLVVIQGGRISLTWALSGVDTIDPGWGWELWIQAPVSIQPADSSFGAYDPATNTLTLPVTQPQGSVEWEVGYDFAAPLVIQAELRQGETSLASSSLELEQEGRKKLTLQGGEIIGLNGKVKVKLPPSAMPEPLEVTIRRPTGGAELPASLSGDPIELLADGLDSKQPVHQFKDFVEIEVNLEGRNIQGDIASLKLYAYNPEIGSWEPLPSEVDVKKNILRGWTKHFSTFDMAPESWQSAKIPPLDAAQISSFTGSATYSIPIEVPSGPGGIQPSISLNYNSNSVDGANNRTQASWVGMGWSLTAGGMIRRDMNGTEFYSGDDTFSLTVGGTSLSLVPVAHVDGSYIDYKASDDNFWKIRRYLGSTHNGYYWELDWWKVWDKDGNTYVFDTRAYYNEVYGGVPTMRPWGWFLRVMTNAVGQQLLYTYDLSEREVKCYGAACGDPAWVEMAAYLKDIVYPDGHTRILFVKDSVRRDYDPYWDANYDPDPAIKEAAKLSHVLYEKSRLKEIRVLYDPTIRYDSNTGLVLEGETGETLTLLRKYALTYNSDTEAIIFPGVEWPENWGVKARTLTLKSVQEFGVGGGPNTNLPAIAFTYNQMHLTEVNNGQGGKVTFTYETEPYSAPEGVQAKGIRNLTFWPRSDFSYGTDPTALQSEKLSTYYPGSAYKIDCETYEATGDNVRYFVDGGYSGTTHLVDYSATATIPTPPGGENPWVAGYVLLSPKATGSSFYIEMMTGPTGNHGHLQECWFFPLLTRYRVTAKIVDGGVTGDPSRTWNYSYTGASSNQSPTSNWASLPETQRYSAPYSEFRGHSKVTETDPFGLKTETYFYQDDLRQGRTYRVKKIDLASGVLLAQTDTSYSTTGQTIETSIDICAHKEGITVCYQDRIVTWITVASEESKTYGTNGSTFMGVKKVYSYLDSDQGGVQYGNLTRTVEAYWNGTVWVNYRATLVGYSPNTPTDLSIYLTGLPSFQNVYKCEGGNCTYAIQDLVSSTCTQYTPASGSPTVCKIQSDGSMVKIKPASALVKGQRTLLHFEAGNYADPRYKDEVYQYDSWGNRTQVTVYTNEGTASALATTIAQITTTVYDAEYHARRVSETSPLSAALNQTVTWGYAANTPGGWLGLPTSETDANDQTTTATYDAFGRILTIQRPGETITTQPSIKVEYFDTLIPHKVRITTKQDEKNGAAVLGVDVRFVDGLGQLVQQQTLDVSVDGTVTDLVSDKFASFNNDDGRPGYQTKEEVEPALNAAANGSFVTRALGNVVKTEHDLLGWVTKVTNADTSTQHIAYEVTSFTSGSITQMVLQTTTTDGRGKNTITVTDAWGNLLQVIPPTGNPVIQYTYDVKGQLWTVTQPKDGGGTLTTTIEYDLGGRKTSLTDPDMGGSETQPKKWTYDYDALGNLKVQVDAKGQKICMYYDKANRMTGKKLLTSGSCPTSDPGYAGYTVSYRYDETGTITIPGSDSIIYANTTGRRTSMTDASGTTRWNYDELGRVTEEARILGSVLGTFWLKYEYTTAGQIKKMTYPDGEEVVTEFDGRMLPTLLYKQDGANKVYYVGQVSGLTITGTTYDMLGRLKGIPLGNGVDVGYTYYAATQSNQGMRLNILTAKNPQGSALMTLTYSYDANGNITSLVDNRTNSNNETLTYQYDDLNRLTDALIGSTMIGKYVYDGETGNLSAKDEAGPQVDYTFDPLHPHAVSGFVGVTGNLYTYDANGNMLTRTEEGITYTQTWTIENKLQSVTWTEDGLSHTVTFVYDGDGNLVLKIEQVKDAGGTVLHEISTVYISGIYEEQKNTASSGLTAAYAPVVR